MADAPNESRRSELTWLVAGVLAFVPAAATLVVEVTAVRLLAPWVGASIETYTAIIGVVLGGLALGAWLGGRAADAVGPRRLVGPVLLVAAGLVALVSPAVDIAVAVLQPRAGALGATLLASAALLLPSIVLGAATPIAARGTITNEADSGSAVGRVSAVATVGALVGTFLTGFVLLAVAPIGAILLGTAVVLALTGIALHLAVGRSAVPADSVAVGALAVGVLVAIVTGAANQPPCNPASAYYCIRVVESLGQPSVRDLVLDDLLHGSIDLDRPTELRFRYLRAMDAVVDAVVPAPGSLRALHIGGGAFALPRHFAGERPGTVSRVLELDPTILRINRETLGLALDEPDLSVRLGDARVSLRDEPDGAYDLVIADVFAARAVPWHLVTHEAMAEIRRTMTADGLYVANVIDGGDLRLLGAYVATLGRSFDEVAVVFLVTGRDQVSGNVIVVAGDDLPLEAIESSIDRDAGEPARLATEAEIAAMLDGAVILTDQFAPTDSLISSR